MQSNKSKDCQTSSVHLTHWGLSSSTKRTVWLGTFWTRRCQSDKQNKQNKTNYFPFNKWMTSINTGYKTSCPLKQAIYYIHPITLKPHPLYYYPESGPKNNSSQGAKPPKACYKCFIYSNYVLQRVRTQWWSIP